MAKATEGQRQRWREELEAWRASGETLSGWARQRGLSRDALDYWNRRLTPAADRPDPAIHLIPVSSTLAAVPVTPPPLELIIERMGLRIVLPVGFDAPTLSQLLQLVVSPC